MAERLLSFEAMRLEEEIEKTMYYPDINVENTGCWTYQGSIFDPSPEELKRYEGFVYIITNMTNGRLYIGKKSFWSRQKNRKTNRKETKESDWKRYFGSCFPLKDDIKQLGKQFFLREILYLCEYKKEMSFLEMREQYRRNVLLNPRYYNTNIEGRFFCTEKHILDSSMIIRSVAGKSDEWKANKSVLMTGDANPSKRPEVRAKISESLKGVKHPRYGKKNDDEHTAAIVESTRGTTFINNGTRNKRVPHAEVENYEADGWVRGRMKFKHPKQLT